jgi:hypothetical protein
MRRDNLKIHWEICKGKKPAEVQNKRQNKR